jgi:hypothetical protein
MTGGRVVTMLAVLASIATILGFLISLGSKSSTTSQPQPGPNTAVSSANPIGSPTQVVSSNQTSPANPTGSAYPASAKNNFLSTCSQNAGLSTSHCQCDLNWLESNYPYSYYSALYGADPQSAVNQAEAYANCPF